MDDIVLATKGYVDRLLTEKYVFNANIYKATKPGTVNMGLTTHDLIFNTRSDTTGKISLISIMLPFLKINDKGQNAGYVCLKKANAGPNIKIKIGDIATENEFFYKSTKKYGPGTYYNVEFTVDYGVDDWPCGPDGTWSSWLQETYAGPFTLWEETENEGEYICIGNGTIGPGTGTYVLLNSPQDTAQPDKKAFSDNIEHYNIRWKTGGNSCIALKMKIVSDTIPADNPDLVSTEYVHTAFGLSDGSEDELASKEYVDKLNEKRKEWPEEYYPYQPDLPVE